jgi:hypothetical protein
MVEAGPAVSSSSTVPLCFARGGWRPGDEVVWLSWRPYFVGSALLETGNKVTFFFSSSPRTFFPRSMSSRSELDCQVGLSGITYV